MNRRTFLKLSGLAALGMPPLWSALTSPYTQNQNALRADGARHSLRLAFPRDEAKVIRVLRNYSDNVYLLGGSVMAKARGNYTPCMAFLADTRSFDLVKTELFRSGVAPVATPHMPPSFIRFLHSDKAYTVLNMDVQKYREENAIGTGREFIPFAHNFLVYSVDGGWVLDPYHAIDNSTPPAGQGIKLLRQPPTVSAGLEYVLAAAFDLALFDLTGSMDLAQMKNRVLRSSANGREAAAVTHCMLNFFPDHLELCGWAATSQLLVSPLCRSASFSSAKIDVQRVACALEALQTAGSTITAGDYVHAMNTEFVLNGKKQGMGVGYPDYLAANGFRVRRTDLLSAALKASGPTAATT